MFNENAEFILRVVAAVVLLNKFSHVMVRWWAAL